MIKEIIDAEKRIRKHILLTPLQFSPVLSAMTQSAVYLKLENLQHGGSFKVRGALNKMIKLSMEQPGAGVITASTGNHASGVAYAMHLTGQKAMSYLPVNVPGYKSRKLEAAGLAIRFFGNTALETEQYAREQADGVHNIYISPYNDIDVIAGQGTIALELMQQQPRLDAVFVSVGGGGLISGVAAYLKNSYPGVAIIGCLPEHAPAMLECIRSGRIIDVKERETLSDGTAGGVEKDSITFDFCRTLVDQFITVSETQILDALRLVYKEQGMLIEGAAAVSVAALIKSATSWQNKNIAVLICGENVSEELGNQIRKNEG